MLLIRLDMLISLLKYLLLLDYVMGLWSWWIAWKVFRLRYVVYSLVELMNRR
jgi:hypothetical protein